MAFFRLNVPFNEKEQAKSFGAKWFALGKYWYYDGEELPEGLKAWYDAPVDKSEEQKKPKLKTETSYSGLKADVSDPFYKYRTVSEINTMISEIVNATNEFRFIMVKGEVTNFDGHHGRHYYFAIKDENAILPCVMWEGTALTALKFKLEKGQQVALCGSLEYYKEGGRTQLIVSSIENIGDGKANLALMKLKAKLQAEGLFDEAHKKLIPKHPKNVGIITSKNGQAIKDICKIASKRNPYIQLVLYHVTVQGADAAGTITKGIKELDRMGLDSIIVGRGGGSDEELMVYNDEAIARAVYEATTPIISAVGHEGHWTLIDYVADKRAATPSEAAEETIPNVMVDLDRVRYLKKGILDNMRSILDERRLQLKEKKAVLEQNSPVHMFNEHLEKLSSLKEFMRMNILQKLSETGDRTASLKDSIRIGMERVFEEKKHSFEVLLARLNGLSPTAKLVNGFGYITKDEKPVETVEEVGIGDSLNIRIHDGMIETKVSCVVPDDNKILRA